MAKIYTRTGDGGETSLIGGSRAPKSDVRVDLYGEADELNAAVGLAAAFLARITDDGAARLRDDLGALQAALFELGALLADPERCETLAREDAAVPALDADALEAGIDRMDAELSPLKSFILPGGCEAAAALHAARGASRRLERRAVAASAEIAVPKAVLVWLNRLSDWLFTAARRANRVAGVDEAPWPPAG